MDIIFFPRNDYPNNVEICSHRYGKSMAYTEQTDGQHNTGSYLSYQWLVPLAKERGIKVGIFADLRESISTAGCIKSDYDNGNIWLDAYSLTPNLIPYVTQGGEHYGEQVPQNVYNDAYNNYILPNFSAFTGKKPVALSYSYGITNFKNYITHFLGGRNSEVNTNTDYGEGFGLPNDMPYSFDRFKSKDSTTRWYDTEKVAPTPNWTSAIEAQRSLIRTTKSNGGWINNFTHWHNVVNDERQAIYVDYLDMLEEEKSNSYGDIWFCGYGEALSYLVYRQIVKKIAMYSPSYNNNQLIIQLETDNSQLQIDKDLLQTPISVKFSTIGTPLYDQTITSNYNIIDIGDNDYIIEIPFSRFPRAIIEKQS